MKFRWLIWALLFIALGFTRVFSQTPPQRVISLSPNLTEMIYDMGAQDQLVGDTDYCKFPEAAQKKEKIGGWVNPNFEKIVSLKPDLVVALKFHDKAVKTLKKLKINVVVLNCDSVKDILATYTQLGKLLGHEKQAEASRKGLVKRLAAIKEKAKGKKILSVLFVVGRTPGTIDQVYGVGAKNFINELIEMAGGQNVMADAMTGYPLVSKEQLIQRNPDVIVDSVLSHEMRARKMENKSAWDQMPVLQAVKQKHVYYFLDEDFLIPGPSMVKLGEFLCDTFEKVRADHE
ncbi:MAG TPA: cobalamin-binding protein [bacterium]|jgi:iron complex transport system substrate-binding protein|nr:cobalamin-binding protein [bacterium]